MGTTTRTMLAVVTAAAVLTGCAGSGDDEGEGGTASASSSAAASADASSGTDEESGEDSELDDAAAEAGVDPSSPPEPISSVTMPGHTTDGDEVELAVDLFGLKRQDELVVLTIGITPDADADGRPSSFLSWTGDVWSPQLIDTQNLKSHSVVEADGKRLQTGTAAISTKFGPGQTYYLYAAFAAPPQDVTTMTVKLVDGAPAVTGVTIQ